MNLNWNGRRYRPAGNVVKVYKPSVNELMKPLSEKNGLGSVIWTGTFLSGVPDDVPSVSPSPTSTIPTTPSPTPTQTTTPTNTPTQTSTPTQTNTGTPTQTPTNTETPTQTPSVSPTQSCSPFTTQYMKSELQGNNQIKYSLFNDPSFTSNTTAVCDYTISGTFDINNGAVNNPYSTIMVSGNHTHTYNAGNQITAYTINSITYACPCVIVISTLVTPTPTETPTMTPTPTNTGTPTQTPTETETPTPTPTQTPSETPTQTPTNTSTQTPTPSMTASQTQTPTPSVTATQTQTPTPSVTASQTQTPTPSVTATQTQTPTNTSTPTQTSSGTPTPTPSSTPPFNPSSLSPQIWVDFSDSSSITFASGTTNVERIVNKGTYGGLTAFTQSTAAVQPLITSWTGGTGVSISAATISNDWLQSNISTTGSSNWTKVIVCSQPTAAQPSRFQWGSPTSSYTSYLKFNNLDTRYFKATFSGGTSQFWRVNCDLANRPTTGQTIVDYVSTSAATPLSYSFVNTSAFTETLVAGSTPSAAQGFPQSATLYLVNEPGDGVNPGQIAEIYLFTRELTSTERTNLFDFLKTKWGLRY